jgi:hypothetical protein
MCKKAKQDQMSWGDEATGLANNSVCSSVDSQASQVAIVYSPVIGKN